MPSVISKGPRMRGGKRENVDFYPGPIDTLEVSNSRFVCDGTISLSGAGGSASVLLNPVL